MSATNQWNLSGRRISELILCAWLSLSCGLTAKASQATGQRIDSASGIRVVEVKIATGKQDAEVHEGDILTQWSFQSKSGSFRSPFDLALVEEEYARRGGVDIIGLRSQAQIRLTLKAAAWGISATPSAVEPGPMESMDAGRLSLQGKNGEAAKRWEEMGRKHSGLDAAWFDQLAAQASAAAQDWPAADRNSGAALQAASTDAVSRIAINSAWAKTFRTRALLNDATAHYQAALADTEKIDARLTRSRLLLELALVFKGQRQPARALPLSEEAVQIRSELLPQSSDLAQALMMNGSFYLDLQQVDKADAALTEAQQYAGSGVSMLKAGILQNLGLLAQQRGDMKKSRDAYEKSLQISGELDPNGEQFASTTSSLGIVSRILGDFGSAEKYLKQSVSLRRKNAPGTLALAAALNNLGNLHRAKGDLVDAQADFEEALPIIHRLAPKSQDEAGLYQNLGLVAHTRGDLPLAADYLERSTAMWEEIAPKSALWARGVVSLGQVRQDQGNLKETERLYGEAMAVPEWQKTSPISSAGLDRALGELYESYTDQGHVQDAIDLFEKALAIYARITPENLDVADAAFHMARLEQTKGDWALAEKYYQESFNIEERLVPDTTDIAESLNGLGIVARHAGDKDKALALLSQSVDALEAQSSRLGGSDLVNAGFRAEYSQYYRDLADMLLSVNQNEEAFHVTERYRARSLLDQLAQRKLSFSNAPKELSAQLRANAEEYEQLQGQIKRQSTATNKPQINALRTRLVELGAARAQTIKDIRRQSPGFAELRFPSALSALEAKAALDPGTVLLSFLVEPQKTYVFVLNSSGTGSSLSVFTVPIEEAALRAKVQSFRHAIQGSEQKDQYRLRKEAKELYTLLLRPAEASLAHSERILILPDGPLYVLPFSALLRGEHFVAEWKPVSTTLSATLFTQLKKERRAPETYRLSLAVFGDAIYQADSHTSDVRSSQRSSADGALRPLAYSKQEAEDIARLFPGSSHLYEGASATEEHAKSLGTDVRFIHFAVHGLLDAEQPLDSALVFTKPGKIQPGGDNGLLQAWELYQDAHWDADLVVLSACESALGKDFAGEGLVGLTRAVHYAGARSVISSLWSIDDQKTAPLMKELYSNLRNGTPKDEALRLAQLKLIRSRAGAAPYNWAAFTLQGDWK